MSCLITCNPKVILKHRYELLKLEQNHFARTERYKNNFTLTEICSNALGSSFQHIIAPSNQSKTLFLLPIILTKVQAPC